MRKTLYLKFIAAYLLFGVFGFIIVATFVTNMMTEHCRRETAEDLNGEIIRALGSPFRKGTAPSPLTRSRPSPPPCGARRGLCGQAP